MRKNEKPGNTWDDKDELLEKFGLPRDLFQGMPLLSLSGNRYLCIINHRGIRQYSGELIVIAAKPFGIQIAGKNLCIPSFSADQVEIRGTIEGIEFVP